MIRLTRIALLLALAAPAAVAQQKATPAPAPAAHDHHAKPALDAELSEHFKGITLTDAQIRQVTEIKAKHHEAMDALRKGPAARDSVALRTELQKHMKAEHDEFMALLTADQKKVFEENMKSHHPAAAKPAEHGAHGSHDMGKAPSKAPEPRKP